MTPKQFIEKAIDGGYGRYDEKGWGNGNNVECFYHLVLDPLAWQAVGKVEGWKDSDFYLGSLMENKEGLSHPKFSFTGKAYEYRIHMMIHNLCEGRSIEQFLETL